MAVFPCDWSAHRYAGPQQSAYVTYVSGSAPTTTKLRLCERHMVELKQVAFDALALVDDDSQVSQVCEGCGVERSGAIYVKLFTPHNEPETWAGDFCAGCAARVAASLKVASGRPLGDR